MKSVVAPTFLAAMLATVRSDALEDGGANPAGLGVRPERTVLPSGLIGPVMLRGTTTT